MHTYMHTYIHTYIHISFIYSVVVVVMVGPVVMAPVVVKVEPRLWGWSQWRTVTTGSTIMSSVRRARKTKFTFRANNAVIHEVHEENNQFIQSILVLLGKSEGVAESPSQQFCAQFFVSGACGIMQRHNGYLDKLSIYLYVYTYMAFMVFIVIIEFMAL